MIEYLKIIQKQTNSYEYELLKSRDIHVRNRQRHLIGNGESSQDSVHMQ